MRILVVEPHPDDAYLSLGWHLENLWVDRHRLIVSVYCDKRRSAEAAVYAETIGADSSCLGLPESRMDSDPGRLRRIPELLEYLDHEIQPDDEVLFPLGLQHPDHLRVAASRTPGAFRYLDTPYQAKQKLGTELLKKAAGMSIRSIIYPGARKWRHSAIFKSQAKFFYYNRPESLRMPEIVLAPCE